MKIHLHLTTLCVILLLQSIQCQSKTSSKLISTTTPVTSKKNVTTTTPLPPLPAAFAPRVVTNFETIFSRYGVPIESWYNETRENSNSTHFSAPGCPQSNLGSPWVYHGYPPRCFLIGANGPCAPDERIVSEWGSNFGYCGCQCLRDDHNITIPLRGNERYKTCLKTYNPWMDIERPYQQIYDRQAKKCYKEYEQGPCPNGTKIYGVKNDTLECLPPCGYDDEASSLYKKGLCGRERGVGYTHVNAVGTNQCPEGSKLSDELKTCVEMNTNIKFE